MKLATVAAGAYIYNVILIPFFKKVIRKKNAIVANLDFSKIYFIRVKK